MWSLTLFSLAAFLQLGKDVQCSAHRFKGSQLHMPTILSYGIQLTAEASYGALSHDRRLLQPGQAPSLGSPQSTVQSLAQACPTVDTTAASFICEPKEITLLAGQAYEVSFPMPTGSTVLHALEVILQPSEGDADLIVYDLSINARIGFSQEVGTGRDHVYVGSQNVPPGSNITVQIFPDGESATFTMTIEVLEEGNGMVSDRDDQVLKEISSACCAHGGCEATMQSFTQQDNPMSACYIPNWHCNRDGHITHMHFTSQGMQCSVAALSNLTQMTDLHRFELNNATGVQGDINTLLEAFGPDHELKVLTIRDTSLGGELAATCPFDSILGNLLQLVIDSSPVSGFIPDCLMSLSSLSLKHTDISGPLPALPSSSPLQTLELVQRNDNGERIYGDAEVFATLAQLTRLHLEHTAFTGTLMTGPRVESVLTIGSKHDSFKPGSAPGDDFGLKRIVMMNGHMTGPVPINILSAPALTYLSLKGNQFSSVPQDWGVTALRLLDLSDNALEGFVPPALGKQLALESADLSGNLLSGPIDALASEIIDESRLYRLNLANNRLTGPVSGLGKLGVFKEVLPGDRSTGTVSLISTHVLNISSNSFQGELPFAFYGAASVGGPARLPRLDIDMRGNPLMICPDPTTKSNLVVVLCDSEETADADASSQVPSQSRSPTKETLSAGVIAVLCASPMVVLALLSVACILYYRRRRRGKADGEYVPYAETSATILQGYALKRASLPVEQA